ncbi:PREDICTED: probable G-protein coupled receptor 179, partial [Charadrius vociferus]|uniref:probable G-protein coupled receptor 179 n=1 Tax=Charadrius vociferus TaxID=50402 RepID=UPI0005216C36
RDASVAEDVEWYQALVRSLAEGHPWVRRAVLALDAHPLAAKPRLMLQATKGDGEILLQDVSAAAPSLGNLSWDNEWFNALKSQRNPLLRKRLLSNDLRSMETPKWQRGDSYVGEPRHVRWSPPFLECRDGKFLPSWAVTLSSAFYGLKPDLSPEFKGVVRVDIELRDVAIDQCSSGPGWFADTHRCDLKRRIRASGVVLLETILFGSLLLYFPVSIQPSPGAENLWPGVQKRLQPGQLPPRPGFIMVPSLHPDWTLLLFFAHTHGTITMTLALLFIPKFLHAGSPLREEIAAEVYEDELDMRHSGSCLNSSIASAWSEHSLDPDDIRGPPKEAGKPQSPGAADALSPAGSVPAEGCPQEDMSPLGDGKVQKHVTYAPIKSISVDSSHLPGRVRVAVRRTPPPPPVRYQSLEAIASQEDSGVPLGKESPAKALEKGGSQPQPLGPAGNRDTERVPAKSQSVDVVPAAVGTASSARGRQAGVCPGEKQADPRIKIEICPWEESESERWGPGRAPGKGSSKGDPGYPGEEPRMEKPPAKTPELPKAALKTAGSAEGRMAEVVCPWESEEGERATRAEICPWEVEEAQPEQEKQEGERRGLAKWVKSIRTKSLVLLRAQESGSSLQAAGWPWGSTSSEGPPPKPAPRSSELPEVTSRSPTSSRASVCPWEMSGDDSDAEVCPWEKRTAFSDAGKLDDGEVSQVKNGISPQRAALRGRREAAPAAEKGSSQRGSPSSREGAEQPGTELVAKHPALSKTSPKQAGTTDSKKVSICPWEEEDEPLPKTEICPWEEPAAPSGKERSSQDMRGTSKGENKPGSRGLEDIKAKLAEMGRRQSERRDTSIFAKLIRKSLECSKAESKTSQSVQSIKEVCPWESLDTEQPPEKPRARSPVLPKSPSKKSQSVESLKADICPWEVQELESTDKAEICPWEAAAPPSSKEKSRQDKDSLSMGSRSSPTSQGLHKETGDSTAGKKAKASTDRESICPWESTDMEGPSVEYRTKSPELLKATTKKSESRGSMMAEVCPWESLSTEQSPEQPHARSPALPKSPSKKSQSVESLKVEICPWEVQELEATDKAEICPWEAAAPPSSKDKSRQEKDGQSIVSKSPSKSQGFRKETGDSTSGKKAKVSTDRESICPWESMDMENPSMGYSTKSPELLKATTKKSESTGSMMAEVCPWESLDMEQTPEKPRARSPALPKSPSKKSQSVESLKAEICPWEFQEIEAGDKEEICSWEMAAPPPDQPKAKQGPGGASKGDKRITRQAALASPVRCLEKGSSERDAVCPWESLGMEQSPERESLDTEQPPEKPRARSPVLPKSPSKKSQSVESLKADICPWEVQELESTDKAEICPWESLKTAMRKEPSKKSDSTESRKSDICPWEAAEPTGLEKESFKPGMCPQGADRASPTGTGKSKPVAGASAMSPTALLKKFKGRSYGDAEHKPLCRMLPGIQSLWVPSAELLPWEVSMAPAADSSPSPSGSVAEVCPWEAEEAPPASSKTTTDTRKTSEVCPWEVESVDPSPTLHRQGRAGASPQDRGRGASKAQPAVCPWEDE